MFRGGKYCLLVLVLLSVFIASCIREEAQKVKAIETFEYLAGLSDKKDSFIFFTDPHISYSDPDFNNSLLTVRDYYLETSAGFCVCGGDWLNDVDTPDEAYVKLQIADSILNVYFPSCYYPVLGNHDTNYQGCLDDSSKNSSAQLSDIQIINCLFARFGSTYYSFDTNFSKYIVADTGIDWELELDEERYRQVEWFYETLLNNDKNHIVIFMHMYRNSKDSYHPFPSTLMNIAVAFNDKKEIEINDVLMDFSHTKGTIACFICGHMHSDYIDTNTSIPVIGVTCFISSKRPTFDICLIDWDSNILNMVRVGAGRDRFVQLPL